VEEQYSVSVWQFVLLSPKKKGGPNLLSEITPQKIYLGNMRAVSQLPCVFNFV
jgi:hypothetical protein